MLHSKAIARRLGEVEGVSDAIRGIKPYEEFSSMDEIVGAIDVRKKEPGPQNEPEDDTTTLDRRKRVEFIKNRLISYRL